MTEEDTLVKCLSRYTKLLVFVTASLASLTLVAQDTQTITMRQEGMKTGDRKHGYGNCQIAKRLAARPDNPMGLPMLHSKKAIFYVAKFGDSADTSFDLMLDESKGTSSGYDTLYADLNNDNRIDASKERFSIRVLSPSEDAPIRLRFLITVDETKLPYYLDFEAIRFNSGPEREKPSIYLRDSSYYVGEASFAGEKHKFAILDLDSNGLYNDYEQEVFEGDRVMVDLNDDGRFSTFDNPKRNESFPFSKFNRIAGKWYSFEPSADGTQMKLKPAVPPTGTIKANRSVSMVTLHSPHQTLDLVLNSGHSEAVAGDYVMRDLRLRPAGNASGVHLLWAFMKVDGPVITVPEDGDVTLPVGDPIVAKLEVKAKPGDDHLQVQMKIVGKGGEVYQWLETRRSSNLGFVVTDADGRVLTTESLGNKYREWDKIGPWSIPSHFDGRYTLTPVIDLSGFKFSTLSKTIDVKNGKLVKVVPTSAKRK